MACATRSPTTTAGMLVFARGIVGISEQSATQSRLAAAHASRGRRRPPARRRRRPCAPSRPGGSSGRACARIPSARASPSRPASAPISSPTSAASGRLRARARAPARPVRDHGEIRALRVARGSRGRSAEPARDRCRRATAARASEASCTPPRSAPGRRAGCREARRRRVRGAGRRPRRQFVERSFAIVCSSGTNPWLAASASAAASSGDPAKSSSAIGWSCRFPPTPGRSWTTSIPSRSQVGRRPDARAQQDRRRAVGAGRAARRDRPRSRSAGRRGSRAPAPRPPGLELDAVDDRVTQNGEVRPVAHRVEISERGVPADAVADVGGERARRRRPRPGRSGRARAGFRAPAAASSTARWYGPSSASTAWRTASRRDTSWNRGSSSSVVQPVQPLAAQPS